MLREAVLSSTEVIAAAIARTVGSRDQCPEEPSSVVAPPGEEVERIR
jgi:hypothetical protein